MKKFSLWFIILSVSLLALMSCTLTPSLYVHIQTDNLERGEVVKVDFVPFLFSPSYYSVSVSSGDEFESLDGKGAWYIGGDNNSHVMNVTTSEVSKQVSISSYIYEKEEMIVEVVGDWDSDAESVKNWWIDNHHSYSRSSTPVVVLWYSPGTSPYGTSPYDERYSFYGSTGIFADGIKVSDTSEIETRGEKHTVSYDVDIYWEKNGEDYKWCAQISQLVPSKIEIVGNEVLVFVWFEKLETGKYRVIDCKYEEELSESDHYYLNECFGTDNLVDETHGIAVFVQSVSTSPGKTIEITGQEILGAEVVMPLDTFDYISK